MHRLRTLVSAKDIEDRFPFKNLPSEWVGLFAPDNGVINVQLLLRTLLRIAKDYGAVAKQHTRVVHISPPEMIDVSTIWKLDAIYHEDQPITYRAKKIIITAGAYVNQVLQPSFGISLDLDIWEMVASYFNSNAGPRGTIFPSTYSQVGGAVSSDLYSIYSHLFLRLLTL